MPRKCDAHLYRRKVLKNSTIYKCQRCPSFVYENLVIGRDAECWYCQSVFQMNVNSLLLKPHCGCRVGSRSNEEKQDTIKKAREAIYDSLMKKLG